MNSIWEALHREIDGADMEARPIVHVRVTTAAFPGSIVAVPISPERARATAKLWALPDGTVDALYDGRAMEIPMHPEDYMRAMADIEAEQRGWCITPTTAPGPTLFFGLPVKR